MSYDDWKLATPEYLNGPDDGDTPRAIRRKALEEAAKIARNGCLVPPDGGDPTEAEVMLCDEIASRILAAI